MTSRPAEPEFAPYYARYVSLVPERDIVATLGEQVVHVRCFAAAVAREKERFRYAEGKWSVLEVMGHMIDVERVFGYRAFCISRKEGAPLPSFDQDSYVAQSLYDQRSLADLLEEFAVLRGANLAFLSRLSDVQWNTLGTASTYPVSVRALAYIMAGHVRYHLNVLRDKYGLSF
jgi:hypothetical protein